MQVAVGHFCHHVPPVDAHAADGFGHPGGVAGEQLVVLGRSGELDQAKLHNKMIHKLLNLLLRVGSGL